MWPVFADPKTDFVFKRIFGTEPNKHLLIELLNAWDAHDRAKVAEQDARGAVSLAERQGREQGLAEGRTQGLAEGLRRSIEDVCELLAIPLDPSRRTEIGAMSREQLEDLLARLKRERRWD